MEAATEGEEKEREAQRQRDRESERQIVAKSSPGKAGPGQARQTIKSTCRRCEEPPFLGQTNPKTCTHKGTEALKARRIEIPKTNLKLQAP